ncbi:MAG: TIR domain-containing protein [Anaerolineales bacterium]|jgi:WD40 repeat protein
MSEQVSKRSVFISYSRKDIEFVRKLNDSLDSSEIEAWVDWEGIPPSSEWMDEIARAIEGADAFLFVISPDSLASKVCGQELELGIKNNKKLIPILHREPDEGTVMHEKLSSHNWVYFREQDNYENGISKVLESINVDLDWVRQHTRLLQRAREWENKNRNNSFLLLGADLEEAERWLTAASAQEGREVVALQAEYIAASRTAATKRQRTVMVGISLALVVSVMLGIVAWSSRNEAVRSEHARATQQSIAEENELARATQQAIAEENEARAVQNEIIAKAQRSAAEARIYQNQAGELDISTLLAIDSWERSPSFLAEDILRRNTSLIPIPLAQMRHNDRIWNVQVDPESENFITSSSDGTACVWAFEDGEQRFCVETDDKVNEAIFSSDGNSIYTGDATGSVRIWDAETGDLQQQYDFGDEVWDLSASPDGNWLAVARNDNTASLIDLTDLEKEPFDINRSSAVYVVTFSPSSDWVALGESNGEVIIWNVEGNYFLQSPTHLDEVYVVKFSPDGKWLASGGADSTVRVSEALTGLGRQVLTHGDWVEDIAFSPDGSWLAVASDDNRVWVWETETGQEKLRLKHDHFVQKVRVSQNGRWIASSSFDNTLRIWDVTSGSQMMQIPLDAEGSGLAFNADNTRIAVGDHQGHLSLWDTSYLSARLNSTEFPEYVHEALFSLDGQWLFANTDERLVWQFPADEALELTSTDQGNAIISASALTYDLAISPDSKWVVTGERENRRAILYNLETEQSTLLNHGAKVLGVAFSPDDSFVATSGENALVTVWDVSSGEKEFDLENPSSVLSVTYQPGETHLATGMRNRIVIWDTETQEQVTTLLQAGEINAIAYSHDGTLLATASSEGTIRIWNATDNYSEQSLLRMNGQAVSVTFSPDDRWLAAGGTSTFAYLWDVSLGEEVSRLPHSEAVSSVSFSNDGKVLATVSRKVVQFWDIPALPLVPTSELIGVACSHLTANISESEWEVIFPGEDYRLICPDLEQ